MARYESPLNYLIKGAVAGAVGTAAMGAVMEHTPRLLERIGKPPPRSGGGGGGQSPTAELAERIASGVAQEELPEDVKEVAAEAVHWGYGAAWGAYYAVMQASFNLPRVLHGTVLGVLVATVAATLLPRMGLLPRPQDQPMQLNVMNVLHHLIFGWVTALAFSALTFFRR